MSLITCSGNNGERFSCRNRLECTIRVDLVTPTCESLEDDSVTKAMSLTSAENLLSHEYSTLDNISQDVAQNALKDSR